MTDRLREAAEAALHVLMTEAHAPTATDKAEEILRAALAEPEAEPVAWGMRYSDGRIYDCIAPGEHDREPGQYNVPLYTAPPRREWQGLTDEEIYPLYSEPSSDAEMLEFARAIEAALKEKNA